MNKHGRFVLGRNIIDIDKLSTKELNKAIRKYSKMANTRLTDLRQKHVYGLSNTIARIHEQRMKKSYVGTQRGMFKVNISGSRTEKQDRLHYMLAFLTDKQTDVRSVTEYAKNEIYNIFGYDVDLSTRSKQAPYFKLLEDIYDVYRDLGIEWGTYGSDNALTGVASLVQDVHNGKLDLTIEGLSTELINLRKKYNNDAKFFNVLGHYKAEIATSNGISENTALRHVLKHRLNSNSKLLEQGEIPEIDRRVGKGRR